MGGTTYDLVIVGGGIGGSALATVMQRAGCSCLVLERTTEFPDRTKGEWLAPWGVAEVMRLELLDVLAGARGHVIRRHVSFDPALDPADVLAAPADLALLPGVDGPMTQRHPDACQALFDARRGSRRRHQARRRGRRRHDRAATDGHVDRRGRGPPRHRAAWWSVPTGATRWCDGRSGSTSPRTRRTTCSRASSSTTPTASRRTCRRSAPRATCTSSCSRRATAGRGLYLGFGLDQPRRFTGPDGPRAFLESFRFECMPDPDAFAGATPVSPSATYSNEDTWVDVPVRDGVVLIGDAAGWNDPITGQGLSITMRDVRVVSEVLQASDDWSAAAFAPYVEERRERMRRLRFGASMQSAIYNEFGPAAAARRLRAWSRFEAEPELSLPIVCSMIGPELAPAEVFTDDARRRVLDD